MVSGRELGYLFTRFAIHYTRERWMQLHEKLRSVSKGMCEKVVIYSKDPRKEC